MFLSEHSVFFCSRSNSLARLCCNASGDISTEQTIALQHPLLFVTLEEALQENVTGSSSWNPPFRDLHLASMAPNAHCERKIDQALTHSFLEQRDQFDAWFFQGRHGDGEDALCTRVCSGCAYAMGHANILPRLQKASVSV